MSRPHPEERDPGVAQQRRELFKKHFPEWRDHFRDLYELGLIPGWRAIVRIEIKENL